MPLYEAVPPSTLVYSVKLKGTSINLKKVLVTYGKGFRDLPCLDQARNRVVAVTLTIALCFSPTLSTAEQRQSYTHWKLLNFKVLIHMCS